MEVRYEREHNGLTKVNVTVPAELVDETYQTALKGLRRHINVPGFRRGHVPPKMVESVVGREAVVDYARDLLHDRIVPEALSQLPHLVPLGEARLELDAVTFGTGEPGRATVELTCAEVELADWQGQAVEQLQATVGLDEAKAAVERQYRQSANYQPVDHEDVRVGDTVTFALRIVRDGFLVEDYGNDDPLRVTIGDNQLNPSIDDQLVGLSVGQESTFEVNYPEDYENEELRGTTSEFTVQILAVEQREAVDAFVLRATETEDLDAAYEQVRQNLQDRLNREHESNAQQAAVQQLIERSRVDIPSAHLEAEVMEAQEEFEEELEERGIDLDERREEVDAELERIRERVVSEHQERVVLDAVAQTLKLDVDRDDLAQEVYMLAIINRVDPSLLLRRMESEGTLVHMAAQARRRKAGRTVFEQSAVTMVDAPPPTSDVIESAAVDDEPVVATEAEDE